MKTKNKQEKPKWFKGAWYNTGDVVANPFSGESCKLTGPELSMYDFVVGSQYVMEMMPRTMTPKAVKDFQKGLDWFRSNNPRAYMVLLD